MPSREPPSATRFSSPERYASMTARYRSRLKIKVTLTLMPLAIGVGDRRQAGLRRRDLDEEVRPVDQPPQVLGLGLGGLGLVRQARRHLEGDPAVTRLPLVHRPQQVAGVADVGGGDGAQRLLDADLPDRQRVQLVVVGLRAVDGRGEDRRVGGDADDADARRPATAGSRCGCGRATGRRARRRPRRADSSASFSFCAMAGAFRAGVGSGRAVGSAVAGGVYRTPADVRAGRGRRVGRERPAMLSRAARTTASAVRPNSS